MIPLEILIRDKKILIVEDTVEVRSALKKMLDIFGAHHIDTAIDGNEASHNIQSTHYDIVLADYYLKSGKDGQQILEEARHKKLLNASDTFIIISGETSRDRVMGTVEYQPDGYIAKPFNIDLLKQRLTRLLNIKRILSPINSALDIDDYAIALRLAQETLKRAPSVKLYCQQIIGQIYLKNHSYDLAIGIFDDVLAMYNVPWAKTGKAVAYFELQRYEQAIEILEETVKRHPFYIPSYDLLEQCYLKIDRVLDAQDILMQATKLSPFAILRQIELGKLSKSNHALVISENAYRKAVSLSKNSCYNNIDHYVQLTDCIIHNFPQKDPQQKRQCTREVSSIAKSVRTRFRNQPDIIFWADMIESKTLKLFGNDREALMVLEKAKLSYEKIQGEKLDKTIDLAELFYTLNQQEALFKIIKSLDSDKLDSEQKARIKKITHTPSIQEQRNHSRSLNDKAIKLYKNEKFELAIETFIEALESPEAGDSVILNAIQTILEHHKKSQNNSAYFQLCEELFIRLEHLNENNQRYHRYCKLRAQYQLYSTQQIPHLKKTG